MITDQSYEESKPVLAKIAVALIVCQTTEKLMGHVMVLVLPEEPLESVEQLNSSFEKVRRDTLGRLMSKLRDRADIAPEFDDLLKTFLDDRNTLAHNLMSIPGSGLSTSEERAVVDEFATRVITNGERVMQMFTALTVAWTRQHKYEIEGAETLQGFIQQEHIDLVDYVFTMKSG